MMINYDNYLPQSPQSWTHWPHDSPALASQWLSPHKPSFTTNFDKMNKIKK